MAGIFVLCVFGVIMTEIYVRTKRPKAFALMNTLLGVGVMLLIRGIMGGAICVTGYSAALSAILGIPGAALIYILGLI